jgi:hypothetical protein
MLEDRDEMRADAMRWLVVQYSVLKEGAVISPIAAGASSTVTY